ncbi:GRAM domain-containing protein [Lentibacillus sp. Marseille-P4043]|uniref:GRAM domain-containing protein n=1 Tax=Lentibacillus sp. Marseille-P4043 TaxID=2040293 RepID=UPI00131A59E7|nr:GRAM domain-containing protein [Lentibacillus sp. Marseille-P4043]
MKKLEGVGGMLYLTNKTLHHIPHKLNIQSGETYIPLETIKRFETKNDFLILRNKLIIITKNDEQIKFRVNKRQEWAKKLNEVLE